MDAESSESETPLFQKSVTVLKYNLSCSAQSECVLEQGGRRRRRTTIMTKEEKKKRKKDKGKKREGTVQELKESLLGWLCVASH